MYVVVVDTSGEIVARRYLEHDRLSAWLPRHGPGTARCDVFTDAPEKGGTRIAVLRRTVERDWLSA